MNEPKQPPAPVPTPPAPPKKQRNPLLFVLLAVAIVTGIIVWRVFFATPKVPDNLVVLSGRIEGDDSAVAPKTSGRIVEILAREGDTVKAGATIARLDDQQVRAREQQAEAAWSMAEARQKAARSQLGMLQEQLQQAHMQTDQSKSDSQGRVRQAEAEVAAAESELAQQEASLKLASFDRDAYTRLPATA